MSVAPTTPTAPAPGSAAAPAATSLPVAGRKGFIRLLLGRPAAVVALAFLLLLVVTSLAAPLIAPYNPLAQDLTNSLQGPSAHHLLGTDTLGRDVLSRLMYGGRRSLLSIAEAVLAVVVLGAPIGILAGYTGGWLDKTVGRLADIFLAIPAIILILVILALVPGNEDVAMVALGILGAPGVMRVTRSATLRVREDLYVSAARVSGVAHVRILLRHIVPRVKGVVIVQATVFAAAALLFETGLGYLGLTGNPLMPTWGGMVAEASTVLTQQSWLLIPSGATIGLTIVALGVLGDAIRDAAAASSGGLADGASARRVRRARRPGAMRPAPATSPDRRAPLPAPTGAADRLLEVERLSVALPARHGVRVLVDEVGLSIGQGETLGLLGESGCGKSLTSLAILNLLPSGLAVTGGGVYFSGAELSSASRATWRRHRGAGLAYVSQEPLRSLDPTYTVGAQLREVVGVHAGGGRRDVSERALALLEQVRIPDPSSVARRYPHELSGGMAQRVALAIALAGRPRLLIADEPTTALDVTVQAEILSLLRDLQASTGMAILLVTHDWGVVADLCHRVVVMYAGQTVETATTEELFSLALHPYTRGLLASNPSLAEPGARLASMPGRVPPPGRWPTGCRFADRCPYVEPACRAVEVELRTLGTGRSSRCRRTELLADGTALA